MRTIRYFDKLVKWVIRHIKKSKRLQILVKTTIIPILEGHIKFDPAHIFSEFNDSKGNTFHLVKGLRDQITPDWEQMLSGASSQMIDSGQAMTALSQGRQRVTKMEQLLKVLGFKLSDMRVLEVGCFDGASSFALAEAGMSVTATDYPPYYVLQNGHVESSDLLTTEKSLWLEKLRLTIREQSNTSTSVQFLEDDILQSGLESESFDLVCSWELLEHVRDPIATFKNIRRVLKIGGIAFHEYNPFFCLNGGHSLCTLDFLWGHTRIDHPDMIRYLETFRAQELPHAKNFYRYNLNRISLADMQIMGAHAGLETLMFLKWPHRYHLSLANNDILQQTTTIFPSVTLEDLITPVVWIVHYKPGNQLV